MSIFAGPYDSSDTKTDKERNEELLVFGYSCKMYRNDAKSIMENSGQLLIPWMGDSSLMVDRYDVRNKLDDKSQFGLKPNLPRPMSAEEMDLEDELDKERYLALEWDEIRVEEQEEMEKRKRASGYNAIGFSYDSMPEEDLDGQPLEDDSSVRPSQVVPYDYNLYKRMQHPSTATVDHGTEDDQFTPHQDFVIPEGIQLPSTNKLHSIIEKTASFVCKQGNQMEIIIKTKQKFNPYFSFLNHEDDLYPYYRHLKTVIASGAYVPTVLPVKNGVEKTEGQATSPVNNVENEVHTCKTKEEVEKDSNEADKPSEEQKPSPESAEKVVESDVVSTKSRRRSKSKSATETDTDDSDSEDEGYLHPLLLGGGAASKSKEPSPNPPMKLESSTDIKKSSNNSVAKVSESEAKKMSLDEIMSLHNTSASFMARSLTINSAPMMAHATEGESTRAYVTDPSMDPEALAAYEYYKEQYYNSNPVSAVPVPMENQEGWYGYNRPPGDYAAVYDGDPHQQLVPMNGHYEQQQQQQQQQLYYDPQHVSSVDHSHRPHSNYAPPPPPSEHQYPPPYYQCPPEAVPPPEIRAIVDKTAEYVAKNSEKFERTVLERHLSDPRFSFLNPWDPYNYYYEAMKQYNRSMKEMAEEKEDHPPPPSNPPRSSAASESHKHHVQKLSSSGAVSFKLQRSKGLSSAGLVTPASGFDPESYYEECEDDNELVDEGDMGGQVEEGLADKDEISAPLPKKQKMVGENDEIGNTVQAFLSTVKGLFNQPTS